MSNIHLLTDVQIASLTGLSGYGLAQRGAIAIEDGVIAYAGPHDELPNMFTNAPETSLGGRLVTPGLIDCHTHLVYAGSRANEFEMRLNGASYEQITRAGGGIFSTVEATRQASEAELLDMALPRVERMLANGVTTIEIKSGYGLDLDTELRMLRVARSLETERPVQIGRAHV